MRIPSVLAGSAAALVLSLSPSGALASLQGSVAVSALPQVEVSYHDRTGSVPAKTSCDPADEPMLLYDSEGHIIALVYPSDNKDC